ncbi:hypothetical protein [Micromonospora sp. NPDC048843]|uniref:hypothetical protein n=1 Tax=Micromonospora sp. NPDC048843 TaxID=3155389 RepID=UPI0033E13F25
MDAWERHKIERLPSSNVPLETPWHLRLHRGGIGVAGLPTNVRFRPSVVVTVKMNFVEAVERGQQHLSAEEKDELHDAQNTRGVPEPRFPTNYRLTDLGQTIAHLLGRIGALPGRHSAESRDS